MAKPEYLQSLFAFAMSPASGHYSGIFGLGYNATERNCPEFDDQYCLDPRLGGEHDGQSEKDYNAVSKLAKKGKVNAFKAYRELVKKLRNGQMTAFLSRAFTMQDEKFMADIEVEIGADTGLQRPQRGHRGDHPTTAVIVALNNRAAVLRRQADDIPTGGNWNAMKSGEKSP